MHKIQGKLPNFVDLQCWKKFYGVTSPFKTHLTQKTVSFKTNFKMFAQGNQSSESPNNGFYQMHLTMY